MLFKMIYLMGERIKNPLIRRYFNELMKSDGYSLKALETIQLQKLKELLSHCAEHVPYYKSVLAEFDIASMDLEDLSRLPIMTREMLREHYEQIQNNPFGLKLVKSKSSGSTSKALLFERNLEWEAAHRAAQLRGYAWYGINPWDKNLYFWGFSPNWKDLVKIRILDFLMHRVRLFSYKDKDLEKISKTLKSCTYIEGYSSSIFTLSEYLKKSGKHYDNIKLVKGTSEKIFDYYQAPVQSVFDQRIVSEYGAAEAGIIAFECPEGNMHVSMENMIVEELNGKIYITNLHATSFPIIRYELGDEIVLEREEKCRCGRQHHVIKEVIGRIGQMIEGRNASYPTATLSYMSKTMASKYQLKIAYFAKQYEPGKMILDVICEWDDTSAAQKVILEVAREYYQDDVDLEVRFIDKIDRGDKKITYFESYIKQNVKEGDSNEEA